MDISGIIDSIPHRYPFLLVDRVVEMDPRQRIVAIKNVTINEPYFQGHFPGAPIVPGVLIIEAMAHRAVVPGDQMRLTLEIVKLRSRTCKMRGQAHVDGQLAAEAEILSALVDRTT
jgi:3-hydroxymyristoyl/3-hydroxydecanoyl-(acyl carrier protein) dehydratase